MPVQCQESKLWAIVHLLPGDTYGKSISKYTEPLQPVQPNWYAVQTNQISSENLYMYTLIVPMYPVHFTTYNYIYDIDRGGYMCIQGKFMWI